MTCEKEYICMCADDKECVETFMDVFGSLRLDDNGKNDIKKFRKVCSHFDKFVVGECKKKR